MSEERPVDDLSFLSDMNRPAYTYDAVEIGDEFGPLTHLITEEMLAQYRVSMDDPEAAYPTISLRDAGLLPMTKFRPGGGVNAGVEATYFNPPLPGKKITAHGRIVDKYMKRGKPYVVFECVIHDEDGRLIEQVRLITMRDVREYAEKWWKK